MSPERLGLVKLAALLLFGTPALLWLSYFLGAQFTGDRMVVDQSHWLLLPGAAAVGLAVWQIGSQSGRWIFVRRFLLLMATIGIMAFAAYYPWRAIADRREAVAGPIWRTFAMWTGKNVVHQRADGTLVEGGQFEPLPHGSCTEVQLLSGPRGFAWVKRIAAMPAKTGGQLNFPMRREDCFGGAPLVATGD